MINQRGVPFSNQSKTKACAYKVYEYSILLLEPCIVLTDPPYVSTLVRHLHVLSVSSARQARVPASHAVHDTIFLPLTSLTGEEKLAALAVLQDMKVTGRSVCGVTAMVDLEDTYSSRLSGPDPTRRGTGLSVLPLTLARVDWSPAPSCVMLALNSMA